MELKEKHETGNKSLTKVVSEESFSYPRRWLNGNLCLFSFFKFLNEFSQGSKFFVIHKLKFIDKVDKMFEAGIKMIFDSKAHDMLEMRVINVGVHSK